MKTLFTLCIFLAFSITSAAQTASAQHREIRTTIYYWPDKKEIDVDGDITPALLSEFIKLDNDTHFETVVINSPGGDLISGIEIAKIIKAEHMMLVVDGACMSACANYLFAAAERKKVLPGSVIVIHGAAATALARFESAPENVRTMIGQNAITEKEFYKSIGMNYGPLAQYDDFITKLDHNHMLDRVKDETGGPSCPPFRGWALTQEQLETWGIKGIYDFWYPKTEEDFVLLEKKINMPRKYLFFGDYQSLSSLCEHPSDPIAANQTN